MPNVSDYNDEKEWMGACVPKMMDEGKDQDQAVGACMGMWKERGKSSFFGMSIDEAIHYYAAKYADNATDTLPMPTVKAVKNDNGEWVLEVLGVPFGGPVNGRDTDGEYFDATSKVHTDKYPEVPAVYYHGYEPGNKQAAEPEYIGKASYNHTDQRGHWYRVILDKTKELAKRIWEAAKQGIAAASSGSLSHLVRIEKDGHIAEWPVAELSLIDIGEGRGPANRYAVALPVLKATYKTAGINLVIPAQADETTTSANEPTDEAEAAKAAQSNGKEAAEKSNKENFEMEEKDLLALLDKRDAEKAAAAKAQAESEAAIKARVEAEANAKIEAYKAEAAKSRRLPYMESAPYQTKYADLQKFDNVDPDSHALMVEILNSAKASGQSKVGTTSESMKSLAIKLSESKQEYHQPAKRAMKACGLPFDGNGALKSDELNYSTQDAYGDDWVHTMFSSRLWEKIRLGTQILGNIPTVVVPQGSESITIPVQGASMSFYKVAQATSQSANPGVTTNTVTTSRMGTPDNQVLTVGKLGGGTTYTGELEEDSIIPWAATVRADSEAEAQEVLESLVIDGDTTVSTANINDCAGGGPAATDYFTILDGFRKLALVTNTGNSRAGGALDVSDFLETVKMLGLAGRNAFQKDKIGIIVDAWTAWKSLGLPEVQTKDVFSAPTIENGQLTGLWGYKVMPCTNMHRWNQDATYGLKTNSAGKIDLDTAANNLYGAILAVRWDQWQFGYKRRITVETQRVPRADATEITILMRVGMVYRDTEASAITYGLNV